MNEARDEIRGQKKRKSFGPPFVSSAIWNDRRKRRESEFMSDDVMDLPSATFFHNRMKKKAEKIVSPVDELFG